MDKQVLDIINRAMIPVDIFENIALEDEKLLWAGKQVPDYVKAQKTVKLGIAIFSILIAGLFACLCAVNGLHAFSNDGILAISSLGWGIGFFTFSYLTISIIISAVGNLIVANMHLFITDKRLMLVEPNMGISRIFTGRPFQELLVVRDKNFMTLKASGYANSDKQGHHLKIRGLAEAEEAEKLIQYYFMETMEKSDE